MKLENKRNIVAILSFLFLGSLVAVSIMESTRHAHEGKHALPVIPKESADCVECHSRVTSTATALWAESVHGQRGVSCMSCHGVKEDSPDGFAHHGARVSMIVSPKKCGSCHKEQFSQYAQSAHAIAKPGREVKLDDGKPDAANWPMPVVGRINPDGSVGSCAMCHARHNFQANTAQRPEICISCHVSDGSATAWSHSPHGAFASIGRVGDEQIPPAPVCVTCHMLAAGKNGSLTHNVSARVTWKVSDDGKITQNEKANELRDRMADVCSKCHGNTFIDDAFDKIDRSFKNGIPKHAANLPPHLFHVTMPGSWPHLSSSERKVLTDLQGQK